MTNKTKPEYYMKGTIETIDFIKEVISGLDGVSGFYVGNIIKYISRHADKGGVEDLKKASVYLDWLIRHRERTEEPASLQNDAPEEDPQEDTKLSKQEELMQIKNKMLIFSCWDHERLKKYLKTNPEYQALDRRRTELCKEIFAENPNPDLVESDFLRLHNALPDQFIEEELQKDANRPTLTPSNWDYKSIYSKH